MFTIEDFLARAAGSEFFAGGLALGVLGMAFGVLRLLLGLFRQRVERRWMASVTVDNRSPAYRHLYVWLEASGALRHIRHVRATGVRSGGAEIYAPATGRHWFLHGGRLCFFERHLSEKSRVGVGTEAKPMETLTVTMLFGTPEQLQSWVRKGAEITRKQEETGPGLHVLKCDWWNHVCDLPKRSLDTVLADDDRLERLADDMRWFFASEAWYRDRGVPWRRGYLLHGPPGTGKSSVIRALASDLRRDIATAALASPQLSDEELRDGLASAPKGALLVLEDIDAAFAGRKAEDRSGITFSGLLNAIDGVAAQEGRALVMTTNHPERLDPALIRPGRADMHVELGRVGADTAARLFARFFPGEEELAARFAAALGDLKTTPAALQGWLLANAKDPEAAATAADLRPETRMAAE